MNDTFYTVSEVAEKLGINRRTVTSLIRRGILLAVNVGTEKRAHWRVYDGQFQKFLAESYEKLKD